MASNSTPNSLRVRGIVPGALETLGDAQWQQFEKIAQAIRSLKGTAMTQTQAERLAKRFAVHWVTIYRYRARLCEVDAASAVAGHKRGWKPLASRLLIEQEEAIGQAIACLRKKPCLFAWSIWSPKSALCAA